MIVKIGDTITDSNIQPIMIILDDQEKEHVRDMLPECHKYCSYPEGMEENEIRNFMKIYR